VSLLDTAAARVAVSQHATPAAVEDRRRKVELLEVERDIATREAEGHYASGDRIGKIEDQLVLARAELAEVEAKWTAEKEALARVQAARAKLTGNAKANGADTAEAATAAPDAPVAIPGASAEDEAELTAALEALRAAQGNTPMVFAEVDADAVAAVVGDWTGIPIGRMVKDEIASVLSIETALKKRVVGQDHAMDAIAKRIKTSRAKLDNPNKPVGVFMLAGPRASARPRRRTCCLSCSTAATTA
jgi:type VI secretion system protein VasG